MPVNTPEISDKLDIFLITYNRAEKLDNTLAQIFAEKSPIKDFPIQIIDNRSSDNTGEIVKKYQTNHPNLIYEKNKYNIGGNANIVNAFYKATKEYIWVLCDDDEYQWDSWQEVEENIYKNTDAIVVNNIDCPAYSKAQLYAQTSFLPGVIYKKSNITDEIIPNMEFNISNMFPHMAISSKLFNENKNFYITQKPIVLYGRDEMPLEKTYVRGLAVEKINKLNAQMSYSAAFANTAFFIRDKRLRHYLINNRRFYNVSLNSAFLFFDNGDKYNGSFYNLMCIFNVLDLLGKIRFILNWLLYLSIYRILFIYKTESYNQRTSHVDGAVKIRLFYYLKTNLFKYHYKLVRGER